MIPLRISGSTRLMGRDQPEYITLAIKDYEIDGEPFMSAAFEFTPTERRRLLAGGSIFVTFDAGPDKAPILAEIYEPSDEEIQMIEDDCHLELTLRGAAWPPVFVGVVERKHGIPRPARTRAFIELRKRTSEFA